MKKSLEIIKWIVPTLAVSLLAFGIGCSSEPQVVDKVVEVEKIVEVEVTREPDASADAEMETMRREIEALKDAMETSQGNQDPGASAASPVASLKPTAAPVPTFTPVPTYTPTPYPTATPARAETPSATAIPPPRPTATATSEPVNVSSGMLSAGGFHSCALRENGEAECWGSNQWFDVLEGDHGSHGGISRGYSGQADAPDGPFAKISAGWGHTCALRADGGVMCWGDGGKGRLDAPEGRFMEISAGWWHTCALHTDGIATCWGDWRDGRIDAPDGSFVEISAGGGHTCALQANGDAVCWGLNDKGQAENLRGEDFVTIGAGEYHTCAFRFDGTGACWGGSAGSYADAPSGPFATVSAGGRHTCGLYENGEAVCWGHDEDGQASPPGGKFVEIAAGRAHTCGLRESSEVVCWGDDSSGQSSPLLNRFAQTGPSSDARLSPTYGSFNAASVLARFSTGDALEGERRAKAVGELIAQHRSGDVDAGQALDSLHTMAPELSIDQRRRALDELSRLSEDDQWDAAETAEGVFYLAALITGDEPNPKERVAAANEMVERYESGDLDADSALNLMDTIAPELSINERVQAAATLARLSEQDDWSAEDRTLAANETFRLVTGVPLAPEQRAGAAVDLAGMGVKVFDREDSFDDRDIDNATTIIKQAISGNLTTESVQQILGFGD